MAADTAAAAVAVLEAVLGLPAFEWSFLTLHQIHTHDRNVHQVSVQHCISDNSYHYF